VSVSPAAPDQRDQIGEGQELVERVGGAFKSAVAGLRDLGWRDWLKVLGSLVALALWLGPRPAVEPRVDLAVRWISFDSADHWDWTTPGCTPGPRVRILAIVHNLGTVDIEKNEARVQFTGRPVGGSEAQSITFDVPVTDTVGTSRRTDDRPAVAIVTLPDAFLAGPSIWSATVSHPDDQSVKNDMLSGVRLTPCR
jgi:hypothetical protein